MADLVLRPVDQGTWADFERFEDLIEPVSRALQRSSAGEADNGMLTLYPQADRAKGDVYVKTPTLAHAPIYTVKIAPWFADNVVTGLPQGGFLAVCDSRTGHTLALLDDQHYLSDIRTAAVGALAARALAPKTVSSVTVIGSGVQVYWQVRALFQERRFECLSIWARDPAKADQLAKRLSVDLPNVVVAVTTELERAVTCADVVLTTTPAREPLIRGEWFRPGQHVTAVGADDPTKCEIDAEGLRRALVFVDAVETAVANGEVARAVAQGHYAPSDLAGELGDVLAGRITGRRSDEDITLTTLAGIGAQDLAAAEVVMTKLAEARADLVLNPTVRPASASAPNVASHDR